MQSFLDNGFMYLYKDKKKVKCFMPKEIMNILEEKSNENEECDLEIIDAYINMNDVIEYIGAYIIDNKYYTFIENIDLKETTNLINKKKSFTKYKVANLEDESKEDEFKDNLIALLATEYGDNKKCEIAYEKIVFGIKTGVVTTEFFEAMLKDEKLSSIKKVSKLISDLYDEYKNHIGVWIYNGFPLSEALEMKTIKSTKVGRNELCLCGSEKKYKKCCGK